MEMELGPNTLHEVQNGLFISALAQLIIMSIRTCPVFQSRPFQLDSKNDILSSGRSVQALFWNQTNKNQTIEISHGGNWIYRREM